jgi:Ca-activated chloride channel family protein
MQLDDGGFDSGKQNKRTRAQRGAKVLLSLFERIALDQVRISIVAFFTGAKPVVVDTYDLNVVKNILNDLPLDMAFDPGKTSLIDGLEESVRLAKGWEPGSTTLLVVSDGDTVPDTGLPQLPPSINKVLVAGVGDPRRGVFIDGHMSRQNARVLRQLAKRLGGEYVDVNDVQIPTAQLAELAGVRNLVDPGEKGRRELALGCVATGAGLLSLLPVCLAFFGSPWQSGRSRRAK